MVEDLQQVEVAEVAQVVEGGAGGGGGGGGPTTGGSPSFGRGGQTTTSAGRPQGPPGVAGGGGNGGGNGGGVVDLCPPIVLTFKQKCFSELTAPENSAAFQTAAAQALEAGGTVGQGGQGCTGAGGNCCDDATNTGGGALLS